MCQDENDICTSISQNAQQNNGFELNEAQTESGGLLSHILGIIIIIIIFVTLPFKNLPNLTK